MAKVVEEKEPMSLTAALGNRKKIGMPPTEAGELEDPQPAEDAKFAELEARVAALEAKIGGAEEAEEA
jgi:hypothetical protein